MRSKKLISLLCAAALTASSFAGLTLSASAAGTPVWSFDGSDITGWTAVGTMNGRSDDDGDKYIEFESQGANAKGTILTLPTEAQLTDDYVVDFDVNLEAGDGMGRLSQYTQVAFTGGNSTQDPQTYDGAYASAANAVNPDTEHAFATEAGSGSLQGEGYVGDMAVSLISKTELTGKWIVNYDGTNAPNFETDGDAQVGENKWVRVRAAVKSGKANITIADGEKKLLEKQYDASATQLKDIRVNLGRADINLFTATKKSSVKLDNIKIYSGVANAPAFTTEGLRGYVAPTPIPAKVAAPGLTAPDGVEVKLSEDFNSLAKINQALDSTDTTTAVGTGINVSMKSRKGGDGSTYVSVADYVTGDKVMTLSSGKFGHAGRGPVATLADNLATDVTNGKVAVMAFAVRISKTATDGAGRLYFIKDNTQSGTDGTGAYRNVAAVLTTVEDETIYRGDDSASDVISTYVTPDVWHTVTFVVAGDGYHRVYVDGAREASLKLQYVATGENASSMTALPSITAVSKAAKVNDADVGSDYSMVQVDNLLAYSSSETDLKKVLPTETEPPKAPVSVTATYKANETDVTKGTLTLTATEDDVEAVVIKVREDNAKAVIVKECTGEDVLGTTAKEIPVTDVTKGDKFFVWDSLAGMKPLFKGTLSASQGAERKYTVDVAATENGTVTTDAAADGVTAGTDVTITVTPDKGYELDTLTVTDKTGAVDVDNNKFTMPASPVTVTATFKAKTYTVTGTVDAGVEKVVLHPANDTEHTNDIEAKIAETTATFEKVPAGTYAVTATAKSGYENPVIKKGEATVTEITVTDADVADAFAVTTTKTPDPEITGTVTITGTAKVGEKLTAAANITAPASAEAKYQWQVADTVDGTYTDIAGATTNELTLADAQLNKFVQVVVTAAGTTGSISAKTTTAVAAKTYTVTVNAATNGKVKADKATAAAGETVTLTVTPDELYVLDTLTVKDENDVKITVSDNKFTMPAKAVTVKATFIADPSKQVAALSNTAHSSWGKNTPETSMNNEKEKINFDGDDTWGAAAYMEFDLTSVDASTLDSAELTFTAITEAGNAVSYVCSTYYLTGEVDLNSLTKTSADRFISARTKIGDITVPKTATEFKQNVTDVLKTALLDGKTKVVIMLTGCGGGGSMYGKTSDAAPKLIITKGEKAGKPITVTVKDNTGAAVEGATVSAVTKPTTEATSLFAALNPVYVTTAKTDAEGKATLRLADGDYIITAVKGGQTIKSIDAAVSADSPASVEIKETAYAVTVGGGAESVAIPNGDLYTAPAAFTAAVTADTVAVDDAAVAWSLTAAATGVSIDAATGVITVGKTATAGTVTVQATYTTPEGKKVSGTKDVALTAVAVATVTVSGDEEAAIPDESSEVSATYTATAADKYGNAIDVSGKTKTWSVTADRGATISEGALTVESTATENEKVTVKAEIDGVAGTIEVTLIKAVTYEITVTTPENGTLTANKAKAAKDRPVTLTVAPATGYEVSEVKVVKTGDAETTVTATVDPADATKYTFTMPAYAVTASVTYVKTNYTITDGTADDANGSITLSKTTANYGDEITVTATPDSDSYVLATLTYQIGEETPVAITGGKFTMPAANVTVTATFEAYQRNVTLPVTATYVNQANADTNYSTSGVLYANYGAITSGKLTPGNNTGMDATLLKIDASKYVGKIRKATIAFKATCTTSDKNSNVDIASIGDTSWDVSTVTWKDAVELTPVTKLGYVGNGDGTGKTMSYDLTSNLRADADGIAAYALFTETARQQKIEDLTVTLEVEKTVIPATTATIHTVYADAEGKIEIGESKYTEFGTATTVNGLYEGDKFKPTYTAVIDDKDGTGAKYTYASGADEVTLTSSNDIYLVYTKADYQTVTFTVKVDGTATQDVTFNLAGTAATEYNQNLKSGENGVIAVKLLPDTYTASVEAGTYKAYSANDIVVSNAAVNKEIALVTNSQTLTTMTIDDSALNTGILTTTQASKVVGKLSTVQKDAEGTEMVTPEAVTWAVKDSTNTSEATGITVAADGTVSITNAVAAGTYKVTATGATTTSVSSTAYDLVIAATGTETVKAASENFEGDTNIFGAADTTSYNTYGVMTTSLTKYNKLLTLAGETKSATFANPVKLDAGQTFTMTFNPLLAWVNTGTNTQSIKLKDSEGNEVFSFTRNTNAMKVTEVKVGGTALDSTEVTTLKNSNFVNCASSGGKNVNGFTHSSQSYINDADCTVTITINADTKEVSATFESVKKGAYTDGKALSPVTVKGTLASFTDVASIEIVGGPVGSYSCSMGFDNLVTTINKAAE